jgi:hypothetical protein
LIISLPVLRAMVILLFATASQPQAAAPQQSIRADRVCSHSGPPFVGPCRTVRGTLVLGGDNIHVRIFVTDTGRILGYANGALRCDLPPRLEDILLKEQEMEAEVVVRPVTKSKPGFMQFVCIASVKNLKTASAK